MYDIYSLWSGTNDFFSNHYGQKSPHGNGKTIGGYLYNSSASSPVASDPLQRYFDTGSPGGQFDAQRFDSQNATQIRVRDALKAGVNPLAALNVSGAHYSPTISLSDNGKNYNSGFSSLFKTLGSIFSPREIKEAKSIMKENTELDLESKRLQNEILRQRLATESQPGIVSTGGDAPKNSSWRIPMDYRLRDIEAGELFLPWKDREGNIHWFINPDAISDADWSNIEADRALFIGGVNTARHVGRWWNRNRKKKTTEAVDILWR